MNCYIFTYRDNAGGGRRYIHAKSEPEAWNEIKNFLAEYHPTRHYTLELESVIEDL